MNTDRELMQQALEALEQVAEYFSADSTEAKTITALRERLAQPYPNNFIDALKYDVARRDSETAQQQEPVAWEGGEGWESLAWELCADENGEEACNELIWEGGPIPEPWGDRWMKYEDEAKRLIALVHKHTSPPASKPLTDEEILDCWKQVYEPGRREHDNAARMARAIEAAHGSKE